MLPDWFDLQALRTGVAIATVLCALSAVLVLARVRQVMLKLALAIILVGAAGTLVYYRQGPLKHCEAQGSCRFLKSNVPVSAASTPTPLQTAH
ncbi:MAG: hypothetical protein JWL83_4745 [Actinomycetia bacterium]|nr:hypothetical protein [Actinomycetes bacterium]